MKYYREKARLSQVEVAKELGITQGAVSLWETGETFPSTEKLIELSQLYKCPIDDLINPCATKTIESTA